MEKTFEMLKKEIKRQKRLIDNGKQIEYDFGNWTSEDTLDDDVLKYFRVSSNEYNFVRGNFKLKALCQHLN